MRHIDDAPFIQLFLPGERTDTIHRHRVTEDFVQAPQVLTLPVSLEPHNVQDFRVLRPIWWPTIGLLTAAVLPLCIPVIPVAGV